MPERPSPTNAVLAERLQALREDLQETRLEMRETLSRVSSLERSVGQMLDAQKDARAAEQRQYRKMANAVAVGGLAMAIAMVLLTIATVVTHTG